MIKQNVWKISEYFIQFFSLNYSTLCFHTTFSSWFWLIFDIMKMLWKHVLKIFWTSKCFSFDMNFNYTDWKESSTSGKLISDTPPKKITPQTPFLNTKHDTTRTPCMHSVFRHQKMMLQTQGTLLILFPFFDWLCMTYNYTLKYRYVNITFETNVMLT